MKLRRRTFRLVVAAAITIGVAVVAAANAHLVYVAITSQPKCITADPPLQPARKLC